MTVYKIYRRSLTTGALRYRLTVHDELKADFWRKVQDSAWTEGVIVPVACATFAERYPMARPERVAA